MTEIMERGFKNPTSSPQPLRPSGSTIRPSGWSVLADTFIEATNLKDLHFLCQVLAL